MSIWTDAYLDQLGQDAEQDIVAHVSCLFHRFCMATTAGLSVYTLPEKVKGVKRITWRGKKVEYVNWEQFIALTPATVFVNDTTKIETTSSRPMWYTTHPTNIKDIRFFPTPDESFTADGDPWSPSVDAKCIISCWRFVDTNDPTASLPPYLDRSLRKAYILWRAFEKEGPGQDLRASGYYKAIYDYLISTFISINSGCYVSKRYCLGNGITPLESYRYPKPMLPPTFERIIY